MLPTKRKIVRIGCQDLRKNGLQQWSNCGNSTMEIFPDFKELLELFNGKKVEYVIVGGYSLALHGVPRYTGDIDLFVKPDPQNAARIIDALFDLGFGGIGLTLQDFEKPDNVIQLGVAPVRIDIMTSLTGVTWEEVYLNREKGFFGDVPVCYIGRNELIANRRKLGRSKDIADLESLGADDL